MELPNNDADFLRAVGMDEVCTEGLWTPRYCCDKCGDGTAANYFNREHLSCGGVYQLYDHIYSGPPLGLSDPAPTPERADEYLANCIRVFGPWLREKSLLLDLRIFEYSTGCWIRHNDQRTAGYWDCDDPHLAFLSAILAAHRAGEAQR